MHRFFNLSIEIEEMQAAILRELAERVPTEQGLKELWLKMALEEEDHARQLRMAQRLFKAEAIRKPLIDMEQVELLHAKSKSLLHEVRQRTLSQKTALRLSLRMEKEFSVVHANNAVEFAEPSMQALFRSLAAEDKRHAEALAAYCKEAGISLEEGGQ